MALILGRPLYFYLGILTLLALYYAVLCSMYLAKKDPKYWKHHKLFAKIGIILGTIHGILALLNAFFGINI